MSGITDEMRETMRAINAGISHTRRGPSGAKYLRYVNGEPVWAEDPAPVRTRSMFPFRSTTMAVDPEDVPAVQERLRREGVLVDFDREGRPEITSTKQHSAVAKALGMKTGRDGFGHTDEHGRFQTSGRRRAEEIAEGRGRVRKAIEKLEAMPEHVPVGVVDSVLDEYDIRPTKENTG